MSVSIRAVDRALDVLLCFSKQTPELTLTQISELVGINKSTVHRILATLVGKRFLKRDSTTGVYRPGIRLIQMAFLTMEHNDLRRLAVPYLHSLCEQHHENVNLSILEDTDVLYVDVIESSQRIKLAASPGERLPAICTASGKAILAFVPEEMAKSILERGMPGCTQNTTLSRKAFFVDMHEVRERGFAISEQEFEEGINAVAAPILSSKSKPIASVSIAGPAYRLTRDRMIEIGPEVVAVATNIAQEVERVAYTE
jgi:DNA-binding IclR family transcriptional regulator